MHHRTLAAAVSAALLVLTTAAPAAATETPAPDIAARVAQLENTVTSLGARVAALEGRPPGTPTTTATSTSTPTPTAVPSGPPCPAVPPGPNASPTTAPTGPPSTETPSGAPPATDVITLPKTGLPPDPGDKRVASPNPSPIANPAALTGPRIRVRATDNPEALLNGKTLAAGTVVEFERGARWANVRVVIRGAGTATQPVLIMGATGPGADPVLTAAKPGRYKDDGVLSVEGTHVHVRDIAIADSPSIGVGANSTPTVLHNVTAWNVVSGAWVRGNGSKVWNSYFRNLRMMPNTPGPNDDYGATGVVVEANDVTIEGLTCRVCHASSPDYDQYGGDGSFAEVWMKGDRLRISHGYLDRGPRVLEAGGLGQGNSAVNMQVNGVYAHVIQDAPFYFNPDGEYSGLNTAGFRQFDNVIARR